MWFLFLLNYSCGLPSLAFKSSPTTLLIVIVDFLVGLSSSFARFLFPFIWSLESTFFFPSWSKNMLRSFSFFALRQGGHICIPQLTTLRLFYSCRADEIILPSLGVLRSVFRPMVFINLCWGCNFLRPQHSMLFPSFHSTTLESRLLPLLLIN